MLKKHQKPLKIKEKSSIYKGFRIHQKKQITGIEPAFPAWEASVLPMNHICKYILSILFFLKKSRNLSCQKGRKVTVHG